MPSRGQFDRTTIIASRMSTRLQLTANDRVLVIAPHPDDESIACGGLLLAARDAGAARCVVTLTDGDNNPWPQRWIEKRWRIDAAARARWGARRRAESHAALDSLDVSAGNRVFFGLPDAGLTALLLHEAEKLIAPLRGHIAAFRPTHVAFPALTDRHPDHSAAHIAIRVALLGNVAPPRPLVYRVHGANLDRCAYQLDLTAAQCAGKRAAIACHQTQMRLSGDRFLAFATPAEYFDDIDAAPRREHPLSARLHPGPGLALCVRKQRLHSNRHILILLADAQGRIDARTCPLATPGKLTALPESRNDLPPASLNWRRNEGDFTLDVPLPTPSAPHLGFVKLTRARTGLVVFDRFGWQAIDGL